MCTNFFLSPFINLWCSKRYSSQGCISTIKSLPYVLSSNVMEAYSFVVVVTVRTVDGTTLSGQTVTCPERQMRSSSWSRAASRSRRHQVVSISVEVLQCPWALRRPPPPSRPQPLLRAPPTAAVQSLRAPEPWSCSVPPWHPETPAKSSTLSWRRNLSASAAWYSSRAQTQELTYEALLMRRGTGRRSCHQAILTTISECRLL